MAMPLWSNGIREIFTKMGLSMLNQWFNDFATWMEPMRPKHMADAEAPNDSMYYSTTALKLVYKDSNGVVKNLY